VRATTQATVRFSPVARMLWAVLLLAHPSTLVRQEPNIAELAAIRLLGARHLLQGAILLRCRRPRTRLLGAVVDCAHAASMVVFARTDRAIRSPALTSVAVSLAFAAQEVSSVCLQPDSARTRAAADG
jgi:hypothetical protein